MNSKISTITKQARACNICADALPHGVRPVFQIGAEARILIAGQAPGSKVHSTGVPFDDPSGKRLREWMGISEDIFYDPKKIAILPMAYCYPGKGKSGDLPPMPICAETWRKKMLEAMPKIEFTLIIGQYALAWHLPSVKKNLTDTVRGYADYDPSVLPLPHPSPRNNIWLKKNPWFEVELVPVIRSRVKRALMD